MSYKLRDRLIVAEGTSEVAMEHAFPVANVLRAERGVEAVSMADFGDLDGRCAFSEDLLDGVSGNEMNKQEDERDDQPDDRQSVEDALEEKFQLSVPST